MSTEGYVYLVQMTGHDVYKIGRSNHIPRRMSEFGVQLPFPFHLCFAHRVSNAMSVEQSLHRDFTRFRRNGEWFNLQPCQVRWIKSWLMVTQAYEQADRFRRRFASGYTHFSDLNNYGHLFIGISQRIQRRLREMDRANREIIETLIDNEESDSVLEAEVVI